MQVRLCKGISGHCDFCATPSKSLIEIEKAIKLSQGGQGLDQAAYILTDQSLSIESKDFEKCGGAEYFATVSRGKVNQPVQ